MKKKILISAMTCVMTLGMTLTGFAGSWQQDNVGWWWKNDNGSWPANCWEWLDGNKDGIAECYYFDGNGYMMANATTPDGYYVNGDGAWIENGVVQMKMVGSNGQGQTNKSLYRASNEIKTDFVYDKYLNLLNNDVNHLFSVMGETEKTDIFGMETYTYLAKDNLGNEGMFQMMINDEGKVGSILNTFSIAMVDWKKSSYTKTELDTAFQVKGYQNNADGLTWKLSDHVYYAIDLDGLQTHTLGWVE